MVVSTNAVKLGEGNTYPHSTHTSNNGGGHIGTVRLDDGWAVSRGTRETSVEGLAGGVDAGVVEWATGEVGREGEELR